ncbi:glycosyltransferase [Albirhodobacter sp. R86504]|uniref:glycosyltransferase n=1 Tax=Albirhodobacter sp. R86504 TaxID=3093848 RepID=UPI00366C17B9
MAKPVIVFVGAVYPGQFGRLCAYLRETGQAESYFLTTPGHCANNPQHADHLLSFTPDGKIIGPQGYYYSAKVERSARIGRGVLKSLLEFQKTKKIDVIVAHSLWGAPHFLYDEIDAAIVSYIEFPSYQAHGWDPKYPPDLAQRMGDKNTEMLNLHQALRSDLVICPSRHAKQMFPKALQGNIEVQLEGFEFGPDPVRISRVQGAASLGGSGAEPPTDADDAALGSARERPFTIGFSARDLSSSKGFETYVRLVDRLVTSGTDAKFVALGGAGVTTYGFEAQWVQRKYGTESVNFCDHLMRCYPAAADVIEFPGPLPYDEFVKRIKAIDLFLYPLKFGVANWGLVEILGRGGCVLAPDRGYTAELIMDDVNGQLLPDDDDAWIEAVHALQADPERRARYSRAASRLARAHYSLSAVAPRYMQLFRQAQDNRKARLR